MASGSIHVTRHLPSEIGVSLLRMSWTLLIAKQIDCLNVEIGRINLLAYSHLDLLAHQICEGSVN
jgi:hypothetical protein